MAPCAGWPAVKVSLFANQSGGVRGRLPAHGSPSSRRPWLHHRVQPTRSPFRRHLPPGTPHSWSPAPRGLGRGWARVWGPGEPGVRGQALTGPLKERKSLSRTSSQSGGCRATRLRKRFRALLRSSMNSLSAAGRRLATSQRAQAPAAAGTECPSQGPGCALQLEVTGTTPATQSPSLHAPRTHAHGQQRLGSAPAPAVLRSFKPDHSGTSHVTWKLPPWEDAHVLQEKLACCECPQHSAPATAWAGECPLSPALRTCALSTPRILTEKGTTRSAPQWPARHKPCLHARHGRLPSQPGHRRPGRAGKSGKPRG